MKKFFLFCLVANSFCCVSNKGVVTTSGTEPFLQIDSSLTESLAGNFETAYRQGFLRKKPKIYLVKFSKADLESLINSQPGVDSVNFVLARYSKKDPSDNKRLPTVVIQLHYITKQNGKGGSGAVYSQGYQYFIADKLCPPPPMGCRLESEPEPE